MVGRSSVKRLEKFVVLRSLHVELGKVQQHHFVLIVREFLVKFALCYMYMFFVCVRVPVCACVYA